MSRNTPRILHLCVTAVILAGCLVSLPAIAQQNTFTAASNDRWFNDLNWSEGHIPTNAEHAVIPALAAYAYTGEGATLQCDNLYVGAQYGPGAGSLYSELPIDSNGSLHVGYVRLNAGNFIGDLTVAGADVSLAFDANIGNSSRGSGSTAEGHVAITDGSLYLSDSIYLGYLFQGGDDGTGSLSITNGDIINSGGGGIYLGYCVSSSPGFADGSLSIENGRIDGFNDLYLGYDSCGISGAAATMALIRSEAFFDYDVYFADPGRTPSLLILDNAFLEGGYFGFGSTSTTQFHVDGIVRVSAGDVGGPARYSAMDLSDMYGTTYGVVISQGATLEVHFGYTPSVGDSYDLIMLKIGQTFNGGSFASVIPVDLGTSFGISAEIVPGDPVNGEIVRVTVIEALLFRDGFESGDTTVWSSSTQYSSIEIIEEDLP